LDIEVDVDMGMGVDVDVGVGVGVDVGVSVGVIMGVSVRFNDIGDVDWTVTSIGSVRRGFCSGYGRFAALRYPGQMLSKSDA
jgi:opacity protein-like surface antigen